MAGHIVATRPESTGDWDTVAELWQRAPAQTLWRRHSDRVNSALVERWLPRGTGSTLKTDLWDEAMGEGLYPAIATRSERVVGDVSRSIVVAAAEKYPAFDARVAHVHALPFEDGSIDAIVSNSTLDHFDDAAEIDRSVLELARVLRPGGTLVLTLDNPANPVVALAKALPRRPSTGPGCAGPTRAPGSGSSRTTSARPTAARGSAPSSRRPASSSRKRLRSSMRHARSRS